MSNEQEIKNAEEALRKICAHRLFVGSPTHTRLLNYLVEKAFANEELNEVTIGSDLYGIDYSKDSNNGTVRSYIYKLRKKLDEYYAETGQNNTIVFEIEKGQYNLKFVSPSKIQHTTGRKVLTLKIPVERLLVSAIFITALVAFIIIAKILSTSEGPIWKPFFRNDANNLVVISDQFVVNEQLSDGQEHAVLYGKISSLNDFLAYTKSHPGTSIRTADYTLMTKMAPITTQMLSKWFIQHKNDFFIKLESMLTYEDIRDNNILFIGQTKTMNLSKSFFLKDSKIFSTYLDGFKCKNASGEKIYNTVYQENENIEYAMVSFNSFSPGKFALYFTSNNDIGVMATLRKFTDKDWLKDFYKQLPDQAQFNALFEVSGIQRNDVSCKLVELEIIED